VSRDELYDLFLSILELHGYTAVRSGGVVRVIQSKDARSAPVTVRDDEGQRGNDEYVTQVMRLQTISTAVLRLSTIKTSIIKINAMILSDELISTHQSNKKSGIKR
jgi:hypothetical protein